MKKLDEDTVRRAKIYKEASCYEEYIMRRDVEGLAPRGLIPFILNPRKDAFAAELLLKDPKKLAIMKAASFISVVASSVALGLIVMMLSPLGNLAMLLGFLASISITALISVVIANWNMAPTQGAALWRLIEIEKAGLDVETIVKEIHARVSACCQAYFNQTPSATSSTLKTP